MLSIQQANVSPINLAQQESSTLATTFAKTAQLDAHLAPTFGEHALLAQIPVTLSSTVNANLPAQLADLIQETTYVLLARPKTVFLAQLVQAHAIDVSLATLWIQLLVFADAIRINISLKASVNKDWSVPSVNTIAATTPAHSVQLTAALVPQSPEHARSAKDGVF